MDEKQKDLVSYMRREGAGYSKISDALGISINTIKSYCKRNNLGGRAENLAANIGVHCKNCGKLLEQPHGKKKRKFCCDKCRVEWWNTHPEFVVKKAIYHMKCLHCGTEFESYGNKTRKYCSHACYISARFGIEKSENRI